AFGRVDVPAGNVRQHVFEPAVSPGADVIRRDDGDDRRCFLDGGNALGGGGDEVLQIERRRLLRQGWFLGDRNELNLGRNILSPGGRAKEADQYPRRSPSANPPFYPRSWRGARCPPAPYVIRNDDDESKRNDGST